MTFRVFQYRLPAPEELPDLNAWVSSHRTVSVTHHVIAMPTGGMLVFVVETADPPATLSPDGATARGDKVDYREVLSAEDFAVFSELRAERKRIAAEEGVPVYAVLSNSQLAAMVQRRVLTAAAMAEIEGLGKARVEKYSSRMLPLLTRHFGPGKEVPP